VIRLISIVCFVIFVNSCSSGTKKKHEQNSTAPHDSLSRPADVGEHKSIHQEEWEYYQSDTSGID